MPTTSHRSTAFVALAAVLAGALIPLNVRPQNAAPAQNQTAAQPIQIGTPTRVLPVTRAESPARWYDEGRRAVLAAKRLRERGTRAKNVILFVGDGMGVSTVTAARILEGQLRGASGEENSLSFERLPHVALSKTYSVNQQTPDSAPTMSAIVTGVKTKDGVLSVDQSATPGDHTGVEGTRLLTILERAERARLSTGVVSTARVTHATPGACYAHTPERNWESDADLTREARADNFPDIARQLIESPHGNGLEVAMGGGRSKFLPRETADPEDTNLKGERLDGRDLTREWTTRRRRAAYVWNKRDFDRIDSRRTNRLLGLFERSHMEYEHDRARDAGGEPSLSQMTAKAIDVLAKNPRGYFLMVEGGRIDHAHHDGNAYRALTETIELSNAVKTALGKVDLRDTLVIVTADHSHVFTIAGYPTRGNDILGLVRQTDAEGNPSAANARDRDGRPYTTLGYQNGPGAASANQAGANEARPDLSTTDTTAPDFKQPALTPFANETHGGEDVAIYAAGPAAHLFHGVHEQNYIFHVMIDALGLNRRARERARR